MLHDLFLCWPRILRIGMGFPVPVESRGLSQFSFHENGTIPFRNGEVVLRSLPVWPKLADFADDSRPIAVE